MLSKLYDHAKWCGFCGEQKSKDILRCDRCGHKLRTIRRFYKHQLQVTRY